MGSIAYTIPSRLLLLLEDGLWGKPWQYSTHTPLYISHALSAASGTRATGGRWDFSGLVQDCSDILAWNRFEITGPLWGESTSKLVDSPRKGPVMLSFHVFFVISLNKLLNKQFCYRWFGMSWHNAVFMPKCVFIYVLTYPLLTMRYECQRQDAHVISCCFIYGKHWNKKLMMKAPLLPFEILPPATIDHLQKI